MQTCHNRSISVAPGFLIQLAAGILLLPAYWVVAWAVAALFHELCHYIALKLCGVHVFSLRIGLSGAIIETEAMLPKQELISSLAGPVGGILLISLLHICPEIAICALLQSLFNLLPIYPFDGGRALSSLISCIRFRKSQEKLLANKQNK